MIGRDEVKGAGDESFWATRRLFETLADPQPLVLVFENIHWAEPTLLAMIDYLAEWSENDRCCCCAWPAQILDLRPTWAGGKINAVTILLEALAPDEVERLVADRLNGRPIAAELLARITASAQGVPLFVEQLLAMLDDQELGASSVILTSSRHCCRLAWKRSTQSSGRCWNARRSKASGSMRGRWPPSATSRWARYWRGSKI